MAPPGVDCSINPGASAYVDRRVSETQPDHSDPVMTQFDHSVPVMTQFDHADPVMTQLDHSDTARPFRHSQTMQIQQIIQI